ncbi:MAG: phosphoribosylformylglycinamidine synthase subunit PurQ [Halobacteriovoraceae bacterium]|jgi:phosphoribosylformylglycinamidine synthase subunit PurQ / glutaminase|nr:phosphoribosylformylglycinamidine synthase subunit PurQ [Halobacteriovoraceae bacterium]MBT5094274.1 phosphoribosylformylglycinamidine synthase subunit PurQ [Halobacteriovoraceae bacterium]
MTVTPQVLVIAGDGINCERETALAFREAGAIPKVVHINDLVENPKMLAEASALAIPGGFSFGDELGSGQVLALKIKYGLMDEFQKFVADKKPILGICNGFQVLVKLGLLPDMEEERTIALTSNKSGNFINCWAPLEVPSSSVCLWTKGLKNKTLELPVRHGEGRIVLAKGKESQIYKELLEKGQVALNYTEDINGSYQNIAGLCDPSGLVLGLMPHPEAFIFEATNRKMAKNYLEPALGLEIFKAIVEYTHTLN